MLLALALVGAAAQPRPPILATTLSATEVVRSASTRENFTYSRGEIWVLYQSVVVAWVARQGSALVRFTGARVTTDWSNISYTVRDDAFGIPKGCL